MINVIFDEQLPRGGWGNTTHLNFKEPGESVSLSTPREDSGRENTLGAILGQLPSQGSPRQSYTPRQSS